MVLFLNRSFRFGRNRYQTERTRLAHEARNIFFCLFSTNLVFLSDHITDFREGPRLLEGCPNNGSGPVELIETRQVTNVASHWENQHLSADETRDDGSRPYVGFRRRRSWPRIR